MELETVTGCCFLNEEFAKISRVSYIVLSVFTALVAVVSVWMNEPLLFLVVFVLLLILAALAYRSRFGYDPYAMFELSGAGVQTTSTSKKMCRHLSLGEISLIQITTIEGTRATPPMDYYVFVKGAENALIKCKEMETYRHLFVNPNRIAVPKNWQTQPLVTAISERYGIPMERSYLG